LIHTYINKIKAELFLEWCIYEVFRKYRITFD